MIFLFWIILQGGLQIVKGLATVEAHLAEAPVSFDIQT